MADKLPLPSPICNLSQSPSSPPLPHFCTREYRDTVSHLGQHYLRIKLWEEKFRKAECPPPAHLLYIGQEQSLETFTERLQDYEKLKKYYEWKCFLYTHDKTFLHISDSINPKRRTRTLLFDFFLQICSDILHRFSINGTNYMLQAAVSKKTQIVFLTWTQLCVSGMLILKSFWFHRCRNDGFIV